MSDTTKGLIAWVLIMALATLVGFGNGYVALHWFN